MLESLKYVLYDSRFFFCFVFFGNPVFDVEEFLYLLLLHTSISICFVNHLQFLYFCILWFGNGVPSHNTYSVFAHYDVCFV